MNIMLYQIQKEKRDYLIYNEEQAEEPLTVDSELNNNSSNPICNSAVTKEIEEIKSHVLLDADSNIISMYSIDSEGNEISNDNPFLSLINGSNYDIEFYGDRLLAKKDESSATFDGSGMSIFNSGGSAVYGNSKIQLSTNDGKAIVLENGAVTTTGIISSQSDIKISNVKENKQISLSDLNDSVSEIKDSLNNKISTTDIQYGTIELTYLSSDLLYGQKELDKDIYGATVSLVSKSDTKHLNIINLSMNCTNKVLKVTATGSGFESGDTVYASYIAIE